MYTCLEEKNVKRFIDIIYLHKKSLNLKISIVNMKDTHSVLYKIKIRAVCYLLVESKMENTHQNVLN